ncbi:hypothetical protein BDZ89DRAFT_1139389 [Hymenopellis radicata]|nr:hypothetical protein BDZ89DRAFT_1139389 [Hymenopellis radicata]
MMPSSITSLPHELVDMIIQHLSGHEYALQSCALVSRTWSGFSQRALFRDTQMNLDSYEKMVKLLDDLISIPHLQTLIRGLTICERSSDDGIPLPAHMSCLASVLSLLPYLLKVAFPGGAIDDIATRSYLDLIPNVLGNAPLVELDIGIHSVETFHHVFRILEGTKVKRLSLSGVVDLHKADLEATRKRLHLPSLECIRFEGDNLQEEFHRCLMHYFDLPNLKRCEIVISFVDDLLRWRDILLQGFPPLELFKLEVAYSFNAELVWSGIVKADAIPLAGLPFQHVHLCVDPKHLIETRKFIEWWSSTFRALSDSKAMILFTELTFTFPDLRVEDIETLEEAWNSLDDSLAHTTFSGVQNIHFERSSWQGTRATYSPLLADRMRLALPRLASRGVLRLV